MAEIKLTDIASFSKGSQINGNELIKDGKYDYLNGGIHPSGKWNAYNVSGNTITISEGGNSSGYVNYMKEPFWCGAHCYYLSDVKCNVKYLYYALKSQQDRIMKLRSGACMPNIKKSDMGNFTFVFHNDTAKQNEIVRLLDDVTHLIELCSKILDRLDLLVKSRFAEMFGDLEAGTCLYSIRKLKEISIKISDGVHAKPDYTETGRPFLSVVNINKKKIDFTDCKYVSEEAYQKMIKSTHPEKGDVLYTKVGATYGIPAYVDTDEAFCLYVSVCLIKPKHDLINAKFLAVQMDMPFVKHQADRRIKGIGVPDLHLNQISEFDIICPPRHMQDAFITFADQTERSKSVVRQILAEAETLKKTLMQEYFFSEKT